MEQCAVLVPVTRLLCKLTLTQRCKRADNYAALTLLRLHCESILSAVSLESPWSFYSQRIRNALRLYKDYMENLWRLR